MKISMRPRIWFGLVLATYIVLATRQHRALRRMRAQASTDPLTGLANYGRLIDALQTEIARSGRTQRPFSVLFMDMNGLKGINTQFGHLSGSRALCRLAETLRHSCRAADTPARFGGDEFAIILPETDEHGARELAARLAQQLESDHRSPRIAVSMGVGEFPRDGATPAALLEAADRDLYEQKVTPRDSTYVQIARPRSAIAPHATTKIISRSLV
jgi:diguanylate cyclase (GGDEF)-like protein